jgi:hypothetical protein
VRFARFTAHKIVACTVVALLVLGVRAALLPIMPIPEPVGHDEFSYLLAADTFASGRLTNPQHPMWVHFETIHENMRPTYASKYPPAQGLVLAFGQRFLGHPWWGVWLSMGGLCATVCWMLQGYVSPGWAFLGGILTVLQIGITSYWMNSYWGGAVAGIGGALVVGALPRLVRRPSVSTTLAAVLGVLILANSRPYEGGATVIAACIIFWIWMRRERMSWFGLLRPGVIVPPALLLLAGVIWMGYYNFRVTGSALTLPYTVNQREYAYVPHIYLLPIGKPPLYRHPMLRLFWDWDADVYRTARRTPLRTAVITWWAIAQRIFPPVWGFAALISILAVRRWEPVAALSIFAAVFFAIALEIMAYPHYAAPAFGAAMVLEVMGVAWLANRAHLRDQIVVVVAFALAAAAEAKMIKPLWGQRTSRSEIISELERRPGRQLVIVRYNSENWAENWVYNRADIDHSRIVWAQDMGGERNRELLDYYPDRTAWMLELYPTRRLTPYLRRSPVATHSDNLPASPH